MNERKEKHFKDVVVSLGMDGNDDMVERLKGMYDSVLSYMIHAGVDESVATSDQTVGTVVTGIKDIENHGTSTQRQFSTFFIQSVIQLRNLKVDK